MQEYANVHDGALPRRRSPWSGCVHEQRASPRCVQGAGTRAPPRDRRSDRIFPAPPRSPRCAPVRARRGRSDPAALSQVPARSAVTERCRVQQISMPIVSCSPPQSSSIRMQRRVGRKQRPSSVPTAVRQICCAALSAASMSWCIPIRSSLQLCGAATTVRTRGHFAARSILPSNRASAATGTRNTTQHGSLHASGGADARGSAFTYR